MGPLTTTDRLFLLSSLHTDGADVCAERMPSLQKHGDRTHSFGKHAAAVPLAVRFVILVVTRRSSRQTASLSEPTYSKSRLKRYKGLALKVTGFLFGHHHLRVYHRRYVAHYL